VEDLIHECAFYRCHLEALCRKLNQEAPVYLRRFLKEDSSLYVESFESSHNQNVLQSLQEITASPESLIDTASNHSHSPPKVSLLRAGRASILTSSELGDLERLRQQLSHLLTEEETLQKHLIRLRSQHQQSSSQFYQTFGG